MRPRSRTGAAAAQTSVALPNVSEHLAEAAERVPSRAVAVAGPSAAEATPANVGKHLAKAGERLPSRAVARASSSTGWLLPMLLSQRPRSGHACCSTTTKR